MPITQSQKKQAELVQWGAARDSAPQVRVVAGPGTGKSKVIEMRVAHLLNNQANPDNVYVISFTRAAYGELRDRIAAFCSNQPCSSVVGRIHISTMHSLALRILRSANLLGAFYPSDPVILDEWESDQIYDAELSYFLASPHGRASEIRLAHDAAWQTLNPQSISQTAISQVEQQQFTAFHSSRSNLYSMVLPGEVIFKCVEAFRQNQIHPQHIPQVDHLIVDEFQDLNACDQEFVRYLTASGATLFVAGDDDQSIYSFRHADPSGLVHFSNRYPGASTHILSDCFRCTPAILGSATTMIGHNPNRVGKTLLSMYQSSSPPVAGKLAVWSYASAQQEAAGIAESCRQLIVAGMSGREDEILILICDRGLQLPQIERELGNLGLPYESPRGESPRNIATIRAVYSMLRILVDLVSGNPDYVAHRALMTLMSGIGLGTLTKIGQLCIQNNQNFHALFRLQTPPHWLTGRPATAVLRLTAVVNALGGWSLTDTLATRAQQIEQLLVNEIFTTAPYSANAITDWGGLVSSFPPGTTLEELLRYLQVETESEQMNVVDSINNRLGLSVLTSTTPPSKNIRILTMHGAKGLSGKVVFIPSAEQGIMPNFRAIHATGLLIEQRRLFYVSLTRAMAACLVSHCALHEGAAAFRLLQQARVSLSRSQFLNEMNVGSVNRSTGLTPAEASAIVADISNL